MLELEGIRYRMAADGSEVLRGVDLRLEPGRPALVAGRSGSGKTTLLEVISGLARPSAGSVRWRGRAVSARQRRWLCGVLFQFPERHFLGLSVGQELRLGHRRLPGERVAAVLRQVGLPGVVLQEPPEQLSGGQQRRLALAVQLLRDPGVLLLDEPTAGLDWSVRHEVLGLIRAVSDDRALLVVTHEPELFEGLVHEAWQLRDGRLHRREALRTMPAAEDL
jgi:energy-coupling factor transport system ATP-binding protein